MNSNHSTSEAVLQFRAALIEAGFQCVPESIEPGRLHRFPGIGKGRGNRAGWARLFEDCRGGVAGCWASGFSMTWQADSRGEMSPAEKARFHREIERARREREAEQRKQWRRAAIEAQRQWEAATPETGLHRYLIEKGVEPHGVRTDGFRLLVPVRDAGGAWQSLQFIEPTGNKRFLLGGKVSGGLFWIGQPDPANTLLICEGFATGATLHEQSGHPVAVAFNAGNLKPVARAIRRKYPKADLVICGDNDRQTKGNPGVTKAREAALAVGGKVAIPHFDDDETGSDWNDWYLNRQGKREALV